MFGYGPPGAVPLAGNWDGKRFLAWINFQPAASQVPSGYLADGGAVFGNRGNGYAYGWNADNSANARDRDAANSPDERSDTLHHMQAGANPDAAWEIAVPEGAYRVRLVAGDPSFTNGSYKVSVEGVVAVTGAPTSDARWLEGTVTVTVDDGRLTIANAVGASNNKLCFVEITGVGTVFFDAFERTELGPDWAGFGWTIVDGELFSDLGGYGSLQTTTTFVQTSYTLESAVRGLASGAGPSPGDTIYLAFGGAPSDPLGYRLDYFTSFSPRFELTRVDRLPNGEIERTALDSAPFTADPDATYRLKIVRDGTNGTIRMFLDEGLGYGASPLLEAVDSSYPMLGSFGWGIERESPGTVYVDWITAR